MTARPDTPFSPISSLPLAIVTGANTGVGFATSVGLMRQGYEVLFACRSPSAGADAVRRAKTLARTENASLLLLDLSRLSSVRDAALAFVASGRRLHALICNAGLNVGAVYPTPASRRTEEDFDVCWSANFIGHALLVRLLLPVLVRTARQEQAALVGAGGKGEQSESSGGGRNLPFPVRIVTLGSVSHRFLYALPTSAADWRSHFRDVSGHPYSLTKAACMLLAFELQRRLDGEGAGSLVQVLAVSPGSVNSDIWRFCGSGCVAAVARAAMRVVFLTPEQGAAPVIAAATRMEIDKRRIVGG